MYMGHSSNVTIIEMLKMKLGTLLLLSMLTVAYAAPVSVIAHNDASPEVSVSETVITFTARVFINAWDRFMELFTSSEESVLYTGNTEDEHYFELKTYYSDLVAAADPRVAIADLVDASEHNPVTMSLCHDILHIIGKTAYQKYGSLEASLPYQSDFCNSGYIHGIFEEYFKSASDPIASLGGVCESDLIGSRPFDTWQCQHGLGHGFMYFTYGDLTQSLEYCAAYFKEPEAVRSCQNGAYMEVFNAEVLQHEPSFIDTENPFMTCASQTANQTDCYLYVPVYLSQTVGISFQDILAQCTSSASPFEYTCIHGVGSEAMKRNMNNPATVFALCQHTDSTYARTVCVTGAVSMYLNQTASLTAGDALCDIAPWADVMTCKTIINDRVQFFTKDES